MDLIADIGATHSRCALLDDRGQVVATEAASNSDYSDLENLLETYLHRRRASDRPRRAALAIAAPILGDRVEMVNIDWRFSQARLQKHLQLTGMIVVNDAAAIAWGIPDLTSVELRKAGGGDAAVRSPIAVIGPGSGLAVAALIPSEENWTAVVGEGGHASISTITDKETAVANYVRSQSGHCSAEDLLSGPGLVNIFNALEQLEGRTTSSMTPAEVSAAADAGDPIATETHSIFFSLL